MDNLIGSLKNYGFIEGVSLYLKLKNDQIDSISTGKLKYKVHLRPGSTDKCVFKQMFLKQDLNIPVLNSFTPKTIIDLGANIGMATLYLANRFPDAKIVSVEPDAGNGKVFKENLRNFPKISFELGAVRGDHKKVVLYDCGKGATGYVTKESNDGFAAVTISDLMIKYGWESIDLLKMDIEGSEKSVFEGDYESWLPNTKILLVELHERKSPGCTAAFKKAVSKYNFQQSKSGEYEVLVNRDLI